MWSALFPFKVQPEPATRTVLYFAYLTHFICHTPHHIVEPGVLRPGEMLEMSEWPPAWHTWHHTVLIFWGKEVWRLIEVIRDKKGQLCLKSGKWMRRNWCCWRMQKEIISKAASIPPWPAPPPFIYFFLPCSPCSLCCNYSALLW